MLTVLCALQLANVLSTEQLFYACIFPFIAFFGAFAFIMYPLRETLHPTGRYLSPVLGPALRCLPWSLPSVYQREHLQALLSLAAPVEA